MKKHSLSLAAFLLVGITSTFAQNANVGIGTITPDVSARLDVFAPNKGVLLTRVALQSSTDATTIATPATGLIVYNTNAAMPFKQGFYYNAGTTTAPNWTRLLGIDGTSTPVVGQTVIWNGNTYVTGSPAISLAPGTPLSGNGTSTYPLTINTATPVYNAGTIQGTQVSNTTPTIGQVLVFNGTTYVPGSAPITTSGPYFGGVGTPGSPLTFNGVSVTAPVTGNGTTSSPLSVNTTLPVFNANSLQGKAISTTTPTNGQVLVYNSTTNQYAPSTAPGDNWGTQTAVTSGAAISGNGTAANPLMVNNTSPIFNANQINNTVVTGAPTTGQALIYNGTSYTPGNPAISTSGTSFTGNGTPGSPLTFNGISTTGSPLSGNGTSTSPLSINTTLPVYNAGTIQGKTVSNTAPTTGQTLVFNGTQYVPSNTTITASNGLTIIGNNVQFGGPLTQATNISTSTQTLAISGSTNTTTFGTNGNVGIGATINAAPSNALTINATNPLRLQGLQSGYGSVLVTDANGVVKTAPSGLTFHYNVANTGYAELYQNDETGQVPYALNSTPTGITGGGSWSAIPGLTKTFTIASGTNSVTLNAEGGIEYEGTTSFLNYAVGIFVDGQLKAVRVNNLKTVSGCSGTYDTWQVTGQITNLSAGSHTVAVYATRRDSESNAIHDVHFCGGVGTQSTTMNDFMNKGVLVINGSY